MQLSFLDGFKGLFISYYGSTAIDTGNAALNDLVATRGMTGMMNTIFLIISAVTFGGTLVGSGMLQSLTEMLTRYIRRRVTMVSATVGTGIFSNMITGDQYLSIILTEERKMSTFLNLLSAALYVMLFQNLIFNVLSYSLSP